MKYIEKRYNGDKNPAVEYYKNKSRLGLLFNSFTCMICRIIPSVSIKNSLYRMIGVKIGKHVVISPYVQIDPFFPELIKIDDYAIIGWGASIFTHEFTQEKIRKGEIHIKKRALIGGDCLIRPGVTIGEKAVVAAKSFVNKDVKDGETVGGVPAKKINKK